MKHLRWLLLLIPLPLLCGTATLLCPGTNCLGTDGANYCVDTNRNGIFCENTEPNLTMNAPTNTAGDEQVQGNLVVAGNLTVSGSTSGTRRLRAWMGALYDKDLSTAGGFVNNSCFIVPAFVFDSSGTCPGDYILGLTFVPLATQVTVNTLTCGYDKDNWDASDTVTLKVAECTVSTCTFLGGTGVVVDNAAAQNGTISVAVNTTTSSSSNYGLFVRVSAVDDTTAGTEKLDMSCSIDYTAP